MHCIAHFLMLIFILTYVWCIVEVSCNNDSSKADINQSSARRLPTNLNTSNTGITLDEVRSNLNKTKPVFLEGGSTASVITEKSNESSTSRISKQNDTLLQYVLQYGLNETSSSTDRKPHIGRKGVDALKETSSEEISAEHSTDEFAKESGEKSANTANVATTIISSGVNLTRNSTIVNGITGTSTSLLENSGQGTSGVNVTSNSPISFGSRNGTQNSNPEKLNVTESTQPPKSKPEFTRDDSDIDDNSSYSFTNPESDYVIPVVATIFAAPLLIVLGMFLYKRSKEFWERRHYRRMDFLIDGMYND